MKNDKEMRAFATKVVKESDCVVGFGRTNGKPCLHVKLPGKGSETLYEEYEWDKHPWNKVTNKPKVSQSEREAAEAVHSNK